MVQPVADISIHALLAESDVSKRRLPSSCRLFLSTLSLRRATSALAGSTGRSSHFYPRSPCGERQLTPDFVPGKGHFYPRSPCGERHQIKTKKKIYQHFYPRSPCGERRARECARGPQRGISIHALLAESDAPCPRCSRGTLPFLSTLSLRRATRHWQTGQSRTRHFYPRSPCGERQAQSAYPAGSHGYFYPRSPCGERRNLASNPPAIRKFLSTLSLRRATAAARSAAARSHISIHALLAESDDYRRELLLRYQEFLSTLSLRRATANSCAMVSRLSYFYPLSPCGERPPPEARRMLDFEFLSTLSLRRATAKVHKTVGHFCAYETNFMGIASSC